MVLNCSGLTIGAARLILCISCFSSRNSHFFFSRIPLLDFAWNCVEPIYQLERIDILIINFPM